MPSLLFTAAPEAASLALNELRDLTGARLSKWLAPGIGLLDTRLDWDKFARALQTRPPIWTRHTHPVHARAPLSNNALDLLTLESLTQTALLHLDTERSFSVQTRLLGEGIQWQYSRFDINERLAALVSAWGAPLDVRAPAQVLSVTLTPSEAFVGMSPAHQNLSGWAGGERRFKKEDGQISRAEFKLLEALEVFGMDALLGGGLPQGQRALDMGAAPGGWTRLLAEAGWQVTAVDPADLDPRAANLPGVRHIRKRIEETDLSALGNSKGFHLLLNDMRMDARDSARLMVDTAPALLPGGHAIITLKLPEAHMGDTADHALKILRGAYEVQARQLFHNRSEITAALRSQ